jgi:hypothetical protein
VWIKRDRTFTLNIRGDWREEIRLTQVCLTGRRPKDVATLVEATKELPEAAIVDQVEGTISQVEIATLIGIGSMAWTPTVTNSHASKVYRF